MILHFNDLRDTLNEYHIGATGVDKNYLPV